MLDWQLATIRCGGAASWLIITFIKQPVTSPCCHHIPPTLVSMKRDGVRTEGALTAPEKLFSFQPAALPSHRTLSSVVMSSTSVWAGQDESCLWASKKNSQGRKSDLETKRFVISCHAIWLAGKLPTLSIAKNQTNTLSSTISWNIKARVWCDTTHTYKAVWAEGSDASMDSGRGDSKHSTQNQTESKEPLSVMQIYLLMLPCQTGHGFPGTRSTSVICGAAAEVTLCIRRTSSIQPLAKEGHETRNQKTPKPTSSAEHMTSSGYDWVIALLLSAHTSSRSALMHSLKTDTACVLQSAWLQTKASNY